MRAALLAGAARAAAGAPPPPVQDCGPVLRDFKFGVTLDENDQVVQCCFASRITISMY